MCGASPKPPPPLLFPSLPAFPHSRLPPIFELTSGQHNGQAWLFPPPPVTGTVTSTPLDQSLPNFPILLPPKPYLVLRDTLCSCEAYGMRPMYKKKKKKPSSRGGVTDFRFFRKGGVTDFQFFGSQTHEAHKAQDATQAPRCVTAATGL